MDQEGRGQPEHHSHSLHQLLLLLARNSEEPRFRPLSAVFRCTSWRSRQVEHSSFPLLRQYAAIERSMRMEHPSQRNNGIDGSATQSS